MATGMKALKSYNLNDDVNFLHYEKNFIFVIRFFVEILLTNNITINIIYFDIKQLDIEIFFSCFRGIRVENQRLFGAICSLHRAIVRSNDINLSEYGISSVQLHALVFIRIKSLHGEQVCQRDIERATGLRPSSVSSMLSNLQRGGFLTRTSPIDDARTKYIALTDKGVELCEKNRELMDKCDERICAALSSEEQHTFISLINKVLAYLGDDGK